MRDIYAELLGGDQGKQQKRDIYAELGANQELQQHAVIPSFGEYVMHKLTHKGNEPPIKMQTTAPEEDQSWQGKIKKGASNTLYGLGMGTQDVAGGLVQGGLNAASYLPGNLGKKAKSLADSVNDYRNKSEAVYQAETPGSYAAGTGRVLGNVAPFMVTGNGGIGAPLSKAGTSVETGLRLAGKSIPALTSMPKTAAVLSKIPTIAKYGIEGALAATVMPSPISGEGGGVLGGAFPSLSGHPQIEDAILGGVGGLGGAGVTKGLESTYNHWVKPLTGGARDFAIDALTNISKKTPQEIAEAIRNAPEFVPGSVPKLGTYLGVPDVLTAQRAYEKAPAVKGIFDERNALNNAARDTYLNNLAGTDENYSKMNSALQNKVSEIYDRVHGQIAEIPESDMFHTINTPNAQSALNKSKLFFANAPEKFAIFPHEKNPQISGEALHRAQMTLNDASYNAHMNNKNANGAKDTLASVSLIGDGGTTGTVAKWNDMSERLFPELADVNKIYHEDRKPVNGMELARRFQEKYAGIERDSANNPIFGWGKFSRESPKEIKNLRYPIDENTRNGIKNLQEDIYRENAINPTPSRGSDTYFNMQLPGWIGAKANAGAGLKSGESIPYIGKLIDASGAKERAYENASENLSKLLLGGDDALNMINTHLSNQNAAAAREQFLRQRAALMAEQLNKGTGE